MIGTVSMQNALFCIKDTRTMKKDKLQSKDKLRETMALQKSTVCEQPSLSIGAGVVN